MKSIFVLFPCIFSWMICFATQDFDYDLNITTIPSNHNRTMICFHGYGSSYKVAQNLNDLKCIDITLVGFNFPDYDLKNRNWDPQKATFGTIDELLPAFYVLKKVVLDQELHAVDLYGDSAGGGALINILALLNNNTLYDPDLLKLGIGNKEKKKLLSIIQRGIVILDTPLRSIEEVIDCLENSTYLNHIVGGISSLKMMAHAYEKNGFRPIDTIPLLKGLSLNILLYFEVHDELLSNRDDPIYIDRLEKTNTSGTTLVIYGDHGGHIADHYSIWKFYNAWIEDLRHQTSE